MPQRPWVIPLPLVVVDSQRQESALILLSMSLCPSESIKKEDVVSDVVGDISAQTQDQCPVVEASISPPTVPAAGASSVAAFLEEGRLNKAVGSGLWMNEPQSKVGSVFLLAFGLYGAAKGHREDDFISPLDSGGQGSGGWGQAML